MLLSTLEEVLHKKFGLTEFRPKQKEVIAHIIEHQHTLALLPTGYGKSLCYQVPSQVLPGLTLVVSPLIALMQDQINGLVKRGLRNVTYLNSTISSDEKDLRMAGISAGAYKLVYVAPERFESPRFKKLLSNIDVSLLVIDEAHCISQWGHDFRPQYRNLSQYLCHIPGATILALTATATPAVQRDIVESLAPGSMKVIVGSFDRPNLRFEVHQCRGSQAKDLQVETSIQGNLSPTIVYTSSRKEAEKLSTRLRADGAKAAHYHAGMTSDQRFRVQRSFEKDEVPIIVCTVAFGMGIDKANVGRVIHYNLPGSLESYYQEAGRAGRDGNPALCTLLYDPKDIHTQKWLLDRNYPSADQVVDVLKYIASRSGEAVRTDELTNYLMIGDSPLNSALDLLKQLDLIVPTHENGYVVKSKTLPSHIDMYSLFQRKQRDHERLNSIINYAQQKRCRRREILSYFGQSLTPDQCGNCDICSPSEAVNSPVPVVHRSNQLEVSRRSTALGSLDLLILKLVEELKGSVGRTTVAQILAGSKAKKITEKQLHRSQHYGRLARPGGENMAVDMIDALIKSGDISVSRGLYPKVSLSPSGRGRLERTNGQPGDA